MKPQPRPALKRAEDADLHPALSVAPAQLPTQVARDGGARRLAAAAAFDGRLAPPPPPPPAAGKAGKSGKGKKEGRSKFQAAGQATSDSLRAKPHKVAKPDKDAKPVTLEVKVPKRVRKEIRAIAKHSGSSVDAIVTQALTEWLGDPRRW